MSDLPAETPSPAFTSDAVLIPLRYLILDVLGQGTFGQVVKCQNLATHEIVAVKVVKNKPAYFQQSMMEVTILELVSLSGRCGGIMRWISRTR